MVDFEDKEITVNNLNLHYLDWGNRSARPMILLHGLGGHAHYWDFFAQNMRRDYHVIALDQRGHGDSHWAQSYRTKDYVLDLEGFINQLQLNDMILIGHSRGGISGTVYAAQHPEQVIKLIIIDIGPEIDPAGLERMERERQTEPEVFNSEEEAVQYFQQLEPRQSKEFIRHDARYKLKRDENRRLVFKRDRALRDMELGSPEYLWGYLQQIVCPTLLLHGMESDLLSSEVAQKMINTLAFGSLVNIPDAGHSVTGDKPEAFESAVRQFLNPENNSQRQIELKEIEEAQTDQVLKYLQDPKTWE